MNCSFFCSFHVGAFFSDPIFSEKNIVFSKSFVQMNHMQIFSLTVSMVLLLSHFFLAGEWGEQISCSRFFLLSNTSNIAVHLFVWYDLCFICCTYEWENKNPCDRRLWIPHTQFWYAYAIHIWNGQTFFWLVKSRMNFMAFFCSRYVVWRYVCTCVMCVCCFSEL